MSEVFKHRSEAAVAWDVFMQVGARYGTVGLEEPCNGSGEVLVRVSEVGDVTSEHQREAACSRKVACCRIPWRRR
jgi:hypothetical protein